MHVRLKMTGRDTKSIRMAVKKLLENQDDTVTWALEMEAVPAFHVESEDEATLVWSCEVTAWDGKDEPGMERHLWAVDDGDDV